MSLSFKQRVVFPALLALSLSSCTNSPSLNFVPEQVTPSAHKINAELKSVIVSVAKDEDRKGDVKVGYYHNDQSFKLALKDALDESLVKSALFDDLSSNKVTLTAEVLKFQAPVMSLHYKTKVIIRYQLVDRATGNTVFTRDIETAQSVPANYSYRSSFRSTEARNLAVSENIQLFIASLNEFKGFVKSAKRK